MPIYLPKQIIPVFPTLNAPLFFLAGPVRGGGDWQSDMAEHILSRKPSAIIACPTTRDSAHRLAQNFFQPFSQANNRQLVWERHYYKQAGLEPNVPGCVIFWLGLESEINPRQGPGSYAMDTRREIGKFIAYAEMIKEKVRVVVGGSPQFQGLSVIMFEFREALGQDFTFHQTMDEIVDQAFKTALK